jgi:hypothetical protein
VLANHQGIDLQHRFAQVPHQLPPSVAGRPVDVRRHVADDLSVKLGHDPGLVLTAILGERRVDPVREAGLLGYAKAPRIEIGVVTAALEPGLRQIGAVACPGGPK